MMIFKRKPTDFVFKYHLGDAYSLLHADDRRLAKDDEAPLIIQDSNYIGLLFKSCSSRPMRIWCYYFHLQKYIQEVQPGGDSRSCLQQPCVARGETVGETYKSIHLFMFVFILVHQNWCVKIRPLGWLVGFWDGTHRWYFSKLLLENQYFWYISIHSEASVIPIP